MNRATVGELHRILAPGSTVYLLGGTAALSPTVENAVRGAGFKTVRISGFDRFSTAVAIARTISPNGPPSNVLVATGTDFPDALASGAAAGALGIAAQASGTSSSGGVSSNGAVVVLTDGASMPPATLSYLAGVDPTVTHAFGVGGKAVAAVHAALPTWSDGVTFTPLAGFDRYATAVAVAMRFFHLPTSVVVASGANWPDALSGGAMAAHRNAPLLLTDPKALADATKWYLGGKNNPITTATVVGGTAAVSAASLTQLGNAFSYPGQWDLVTNP
jgi:putative cell wall-binding protein